MIGHVEPPPHSAQDHQPGQDPEAPITVGTGVVDEGDGNERYDEVTAPAWISYAGETRRMTAAVKALGLL